MMGNLLVEKVGPHFYYKFLVGRDIKWYNSFVSIYIGGLKHVMLGGFELSQPKKLAQEIKFSFILINLSPVPSATMWDNFNNLPLTHQALGGSESVSFMYY